MKKLFSKRFAVLFAAFAVAVCTVSTAFADTETETAMTTALASVKSDAVSALGVVAPIAIGIMGAFLVWKFGIKFFKGLAK